MKIPMSAKASQWRKSIHHYSNDKVAEHTTNMNSAIPNTKAEYETTLAGYYGEIWEYDGEHYMVIIRHSARANKFAAFLGDAREFKRGDEALFKIGKNALPDAKTAIKTPKSHATRVRLANEFGKRK